MDDALCLEESFFFHLFAAGVQSTNLDIRDLTIHSGSQKLRRYPTSWLQLLPLFASYTYPCYYYDTSRSTALKCQL